MYNITISIPDDLLKAGREYAKAHRVSLNALIRQLLVKTVTKSNQQQWMKECFQLMDKKKINSRGRKWNREDLYNV